MGKSTTEIFSGLKGDGFEEPIVDQKTFTEVMEQLERLLEKHRKENRSSENE